MLTDENIKSNPLPQPQKKKNKKKQTKQKQNKTYPPIFTHKIKGKNVYQAPTHYNALI